MADAAVEDLAALEAVRSGSEWLRSIACTLARRGAAFRLENPARARMLLDALGPSPLYKAGQFLFDLLEWEDFMLDGTPPAVLPTTLDARSVARLASLLRAMKGHLDGTAEPAAAPASTESPSLDPAASADSPNGENLPPLEGGFYLYDDVVLGILRSYAANGAASGARAPQAASGAEF